MGWVVKEVTETVTHRRQASVCDGCGREVYQGRPVYSDPPLAWQTPNGWVSVSMGEDRQRWVQTEEGLESHGLACSPECALLLTNRAFGVRSAGGQAGGIKRRITGMVQGRGRP